jgi:hypothetical protein
MLIGMQGGLFGKLGTSWINMGISIIFSNYCYPVSIFLSQNDHPQNDKTALSIRVTIRNHSVFLKNINA